MRRLVMTVLVAAAAACQDAPARQAAPPPPAIGPVVLIWGADLELLDARYPAIVDQIYRSPNAYVIGDPDGHQDQVLPGSQAHPTLLYTSYGSFRRDAYAGRIDPIVDTVIYNPEAWPQTPTVEQRDPHAAIHRFIRLAHQAGFQVIVAPGRDLALVSRGCRKRRAETLDAAYLRCRYAADARGADMILLQTGADELAAGGLDRFLEKAVTQIRRSQPDVTLLGVISTQPTSHITAWPGGLVRATRIVIGRLAGFALNLTPGTADVAADYLRDAKRGGALRERPGR